MFHFMALRLVPVLVYESEAGTMCKRAMLQLYLQTKFVKFGQ